MSFISENRFFHRAFTFDDLTKKCQCKNVRFIGVFQFLQYLLFQRVYGINLITRPTTRRISKQEQQENSFEVFLGGSCNPTTWRYELAIPYFQSHSISYYNPQVSNWTPDLVEIEHQAKESAPLLFFVIDHRTRSLAAIAEACYLTARRRNIIVVLTTMPDDKNQIKFIQQKNHSNELDDKNDYENVSEARRTLRILLQSIDVPVFDNIRIALECATSMLEMIRQTAEHSNIIDEDKNSINESEKDQSDTISSTPTSSRRRHSLKTTCSSSSLSPLMHSTYFPIGLQLRQPSYTAKTQISCTTNETDDEGYGSLASSNRTRSQSSSSTLSDVCDYSIDENNSSRFYLPMSIVNNIISIFSSSISFITPPILLNSSLIQSFFLLGARIKTALLSSITCREKNILFDLYIASGNQDDDWLNIHALSLLDDIHIKYTKRQIDHEDDQLDILCDIHTRKRSRLLYYLINENERLSSLATELAFLIGERKHHIIVCLQPKINENSEKILTKTERQDIERSRKYLHDIANKEKIFLSQSRTESWQQVLAFLLHNPN